MCSSLVVIPSFGEFPGGKGRRSNDVRRPARGEAKSFYLEKVFGEVHFTPCGATRRCYEQPSAGERPSDGSPERPRGGTRPTRHPAVASLTIAGQPVNSEKRRRHCRLQAYAVEVGFQTLALCPKPRAGSARLGGRTRTASRVGLMAGRLRPATAGSSKPLGVFTCARSVAAERICRQKHHRRSSTSMKEGRECNSDREREKRAAPQAPLFFPIPPFTLRH